MKKIILVISALSITISSWAYSFMDNNFYYNTTSSTTVAVTYNTASYNSYSGAIVIPIEH